MCIFAGILMKVPLFLQRFWLNNEVFNTAKPYFEFSEALHYTGCILTGQTCFHLISFDCKYQSHWLCKCVSVNFRVTLLQWLTAHKLIPKSCLKYLIRMEAFHRVCWMPAVPPHQFLHAIMTVGVYLCRRDIQKCNKLLNIVLKSQKK